ncbi:fimbria/pilus periplasmic chaperone [Dyella amyloliquefaciens]|uniref:fimbria/pilus periplasmic chaperone n=1 Tax=Dyella amyloliquefaciens TaxID=1770545 RepID=UPI00102ED3B8|nr:fimbria/pilus periplasmic chaperone [Dyella amyloliquefaciens]
MSNVLRYAMTGALAVVGFIAAQSSHASVVIGGTRVVYPSQEKEVTVKLTNQGTKPALVQVWLDNGDEKSTPDTAKVPFTITPPISRIDPTKGLAIRVLYTKEPLPTDKETLFWLNMLEVPPKPADSEGRNLLQFAFRTRIKVFFRPAGLQGDIATAPEKLSWKLVPADKGWALQVNNPTPYFISFAHVGIKTGDKIVGDEGGGMVAPGGNTTFPLKDVGSPASDAQAAFDVISDFGAISSMTHAVTR